MRYYGGSILVLGTRTILSPRKKKDNSESKTNSKYTRHIAHAITSVWSSLTAEPCKWSSRVGVTRACFEGGQVNQVSQGNHRGTWGHVRARGGTRGHAHRDQGPTNGPERVGQGIIKSLVNCDGRVLVWDQGDQARRSAVRRHGATDSPVLARRSAPLGRPMSAAQRGF